jgi:hypothetical protein
MTNALLHLNWLTVAMATVIGFLFGWLWYSPLLFGKAWKREMKITDQDIQRIKEKGMAGFFIQGILYTVISTIGLAILLKAHLPSGPGKAALYGAFLGALIVGARLLNAGVWEQRSIQLSAIKVGHEVCLFALQAAILAMWW